jgi:hypothetical protein
VRRMGRLTALSDCVQKRSRFFMRFSISFPTLEYAFLYVRLKMIHSGALPIASRSSS